MAFTKFPAKKPDPEFPFSTEDQAIQFAVGAGYSVHNGVASRDDAPSRFRLTPHATLKGKFVWTQMLKK